jgi:hypothetical protein
MTEKKALNWKYILLKGLILQVIFLVLHYAYDFFPNGFTRIISGTSEAVFQHMKIGFFSIGLVNLIEFFLKRTKVDRPGDFGFARMASAMFYCWPMFILFFTPPAFYGKYPNDLLEIISANIILYLTSISSLIFENQLERVEITREFKVVIAALTLIFISLLVIYSFQDPWFDVFAIPPGWE